MTEREERTGRQRRRLTATVTDLDVGRQRAFLVGVVDGQGDVEEAETSLRELALLSDTAGSDPVSAELVKRRAPDPAKFIGSGKVRELVAETKALNIDVVVFDNELSAAQQRNLNQSFECDVVDRVALILDIFAQHATSREGMLQVELAQHRYRLPRLRGKGTELSRLGAGIGTRGPGETKLETDRRRILERISKVERELEDVARSRQTKSKARRRAGIPVVALVGYTNAGKSTLFNQMTDASALVEDQLFATVDSTVRKLELPGGHHVLMSDTVGFLRRLPHELVESFRSTLEEATDAAVLLHIVDAADPNPDRQIDAVRIVLREIGAGDTEELLVFNKIDIAESESVHRLRQLHPGSTAVSALTGEGINELGGVIVDTLRAQAVELELLVPYDRGSVVAALHESGEILKEEHRDDGTWILARVPGDEAGPFRRFAV